MNFDLAVDFLVQRILDDNDARLIEDNTQWYDDIASGMYDFVVYNPQARVKVPARRASYQYIYK